MGKRKGKRKSERRRDPGAPSEGMRLVDRALSAGATLEEVAKALDVSWWTVYRWARGSHAPHALALRELRRYVGRLRAA